MGKRKYFCLIFIFLLFPCLTKADGIIIRPLPHGEWDKVEEATQEVFINKEGNVQKLIISVELKEKSPELFWIIPIPSLPENIEIDVVSQLPIFFGEEVISRAKRDFLLYLEGAYGLGMFGQIWPLPFAMVPYLFNPTLGVGATSEERRVGDSVFVETHIEKEGMVGEVVTAKDSEAIFRYLSEKGLNIKRGDILELDLYIEKNYSFVIFWINSHQESKGNARGIFISFPTSQIYYPMILTSAYGELRIPITIRVLDHVKPEIFPEIKPYTKVFYYAPVTPPKMYYGDEYYYIFDIESFYFTCRNYMDRLAELLNFFHSKNNSYPNSLDELLNSEYGEKAKEIIYDIKNECQSSPSYFSSENNKSYVLKLRLPKQVLVEITPHESKIYYREKREEFVPQELEKFYGSKKPWAGEAMYTKIVIDAPAKLLKQDLWIKDKRPFLISLALWVIMHPIISLLLLYFIIVGPISFIAGGIAGFIRARKFKNYAILGLTNIFSLIFLILISLSLNLKRPSHQSKNDYSIKFIFLFSIIFLIILVCSSMLLPFTDLKLYMMWVGGSAIVWALLSWITLAFVGALLDKINLKNKIARVIILTVSLIGFWISVCFLLLPRLMRLI